ncbi:MAG: amidophosphoribosyltransferase [Clostridia bacterium]|nr:amidophosphoribosyltransferase [Clostridia bacterium]
MTDKSLSERKIKEACGIFGIISRETSELARKTYFGLFALQHRGQESAGIAVSYEKDKAVYYKNMGLVNDVFGEAELKLLPPTTVAIGHVRYSTTGSSNVVNAQPVVFYGKKGRMAVAHNGNVVNANQIKAQMLDKGHIFQSSIDSEVIAARINFHIKDDLVGGIVAACEEFLGAFSLLIMAEGKLVAVRDRHGLKPLIVGKTPEGEMVVASESCALDAVGAEIIRDVKPGEVLIIDENLGMESRFLKNIDPKFCIFEYVYISRSDSVIDGVSVYDSRYKCGRMLAELYKIDADLVAGVPDSALVCAKGYSDVSGIPMVDAISKNRYVGRTFIQPTQSIRESSVSLKLNAFRSNIEGKRIILIDDSIVRGTTSKKIISLLRKNGAKEIHMLVGSPIVCHPCYFGVDMQTKEELVGGKITKDDICMKIGADSLNYIPLECLKIACGGGGFCSACFDGVYPDSVTDDETGKFIFE